MWSLNGVTTYEVWHRRQLNMSYPRAFGYVTHMKKVILGITKLSDRSTPMVFVGYKDGSKAYCVYGPTMCKLHATREVILGGQVVGLECCVG